MKYSITLGIEQMRIVEEALEVYFRLGMGQIRDAMEQLPQGERPREWTEWHDSIRDIRAILGPHMGLSASEGHSFGIRSQFVSPRHKTAHDIYIAMRYRRSWDDAYKRGVIKPGEPRKFSEMMGVNYDEPHPIELSELPKVEIVEGKTW